MRICGLARPSLRRPRRPEAGLARPALRIGNIPLARQTSPRTFDLGSRCPRWGTRRPAPNHLVLKCNEFRLLLMIGLSAPTTYGFIKRT